jgi:hypothetical protein
VRPSASLRLCAAVLFVPPVLVITGAVAAAPRPHAEAQVPAPAGMDTGAPAAESAVAVLAVADPRTASTEAALAAFGRHATRLSHPDALRQAFNAYYGYIEANADKVRKPYLYFVDLGLDNRTARGYVFDMRTLSLVDGPFTVAHGSGSSRTRDAVPTTFSNRPGSFQSSLGLYLAEETYTFRGRAAGGAYTSVGLRMRGESGPFNAAARARGIVAHGAPYVTAQDAGRSEGCPAMEQHRARRLLPMLADGGVVFIYSPNDERWLREDPWLNME